MSHLKSYDVSFLLRDHVYASVFTEKDQFLKEDCKEFTNFFNMTYTYM